VHPGDASTSQVREQPLDEGATKTGSPRPLLEVDVQVRRVPVRELGGCSLWRMDETDELCIARVVLAERVTRAEQGPPLPLGPGLEGERVIGREQVAGRTLIVADDELSASTLSQVGSDVDVAEQVGVSMECLTVRPGVYRQETGAIGTGQVMQTSGFDAEHVGSLARRGAG